MNKVKRLSIFLLILLGFTNFSVAKNGVNKTLENSEIKAQIVKDSKNINTKFDSCMKDEECKIAIYVACATNQECSSMCLNNSDCKEYVEKEMIQKYIESAVFGLKAMLNKFANQDQISKKEEVKNESK